MPWTAGQRLQGGKYVIEQVLGQGGFGITYKALHVELNRQVVIKTPNEYLSHNPEYKKYIERFIREGQTLAQLSQDPHPHIVGVIDLFEEGSTHCLVMNFVSGENLFEAVRHRGALPEDLIVPYIRQIGKALMVVHEAGLVHRDAHPGNIMLGSNGKAVLIDFGIAKGFLPRTLSSTGNAGNHGFAPYEQIIRGSREPTVDVYCLAATLYYAVTGQPSTTSLARKLDGAFLTPPKRIVPSISDRLNKAIIKGMALEAKDRPQSMQAWLAMLEAPKPTPPPSVKPVHRKEVVRPKAKSESKTTLDKPATKPTRTIPWGWLTGSLGLSMLEISKATPPPAVKPIHRTEVVRPKAQSEPEATSDKQATKPTETLPWGWLDAWVWGVYGLIGYLLAVSHAPFWAVAMVGVMAVAVAMAVAMLGSWGFLIVVLSGGAGAGALVGAWTVGWVVAWVWVLKCVLVGSVAVVIGLVAFTMAVAVVGDQAGVGAVCVALAVAMPGVVALAVAGARVVNLAVAVAGVVAGVGAFFLVGFATVSTDKLQKSFTKFYSFLILAGTSGMGLALGWLVRWFLTQDLVGKAM